MLLKQFKVLHHEIHCQILFFFFGSLQTPRRSGGASSVSQNQVFSRYIYQTNFQISCKTSKGLKNKLMRASITFVPRSSSRRALNLLDSEAGMNGGRQAAERRVDAETADRTGDRNASDCQTACQTWRRPSTVWSRTICSSLWSTVTEMHRAFTFYGGRQGKTVLIAASARNCAKQKNAAIAQSWNRSNKKCNVLRATRDKICRKEMQQVY